MTCPIAARSSGPSTYDFLRRPICAWKPSLMADTEREAPQALHFSRKSRCSLVRTVSANSIDDPADTEAARRASAAAAHGPAQLELGRTGGFAHVADDVFVHVATEDAFEHLWQEAALDDEPLLAIERATRAQFREQESHNVLRLPLHRLAQLDEVREHRLLGSLSQHLRRLENLQGARQDRLRPRCSGSHTVPYLAPLLALQVRVVLPQNAEHAVQQLLVPAGSAANTRVSHPSGATMATAKKTSDTDDSTNWQAARELAST
eukprot:scaffold2090_cov225-Prasinococcus_capsulatus_cf.AAC.13